MATSNSVVEIESNNNLSYFIIEDDEFFRENRYVLGARLCRTSSNIGSLLVGSKSGDLVNIEGKNGLVKKIYDKYGYIAVCGVKAIEPNNHIQVITAEDGDINTGLQKIKQILIENNTQIQKRFVIYKREKYVPVSAVVGKERTFEDYCKTIGPLLNDDNYPYYAGEPLDVDFEKGFVMDITSIIVMRVLGVLENLPNSVASKAFITSSTKMKFKRFYEDLVNRKKDITEQLYIGIDKELHLSERRRDDEVLYWKPVNNFIEQANEILYEGSYDDAIINDDVYDKCQIDSIKYAKEQGLPYVCDDLSTRVMANLYQVNHTNSLMLVTRNVYDYMKLMNILDSYAKSNYVYAVFPSLNKYIFKPILDNFDKKEYQNEFSTFITLCMKNAVSKECHAPVLKDIKKAIEPYRYFEIFDNSIYENLFVSFVLEVINNAIDDVF